MKNARRSQFLDFVTANPRLLPDGLPKIEVAKQQGRSPIPTSQTCSNLLSLPIYKSREDLQLHLDEALLNGASGGFHELGLHDTVAAAADAAAALRNME